jgi:hypothetical protein
MNWSRILLKRTPDARHVGVTRDGDREFGAALNTAVIFGY